MGYGIEWRPPAVPGFKRLGREAQERIRPAVDRLAENPRPPGVEKLAGRENRYRVRVGDDRIVFEIRDVVLLVLVVAVGHRRDVYH